MENKLKAHFEKEIEEAKELISIRKFDEAFKHLERAHVLGQEHMRSHLISHLLMLQIALLKLDFKEIFGQIYRVPLAIYASRFGKIPVGNTGGASVPAFKELEIPQDLKELM